MLEKNGTKLAFLLMFKLILPQFRLKCPFFIVYLCISPQSLSAEIFFCPPGDFKVKVKVTKSLIF